MSIVDIHAPAGDGYGVIYADPPWSYRQQGNGAAARHYPASNAWGNEVQDHDTALL